MSWIAILWLVAPAVGLSLILQKRVRQLRWGGAIVLGLSAWFWVATYLTFQQLGEYAAMCEDPASERYLGPAHPDCVAARERLSRR